MSETNKKLKLFPVKKMAVIRQAELPSTTRIVPVTSSAPQVGEIVALGESKHLVRFKVGDLVAYRQFGEFEFFINGESLYFVRFDDILGVIKTEGCCDD